MVASSSVAPALRYVLTDLGRQALENDQACHCTWEFDLGLIVCPKCGTIYSTRADIADRYQRSFMKHGYVR